MWLPILLALALADPSGSASIDPASVGQAIADRRPRVHEFRAIKEAADELGFRVWLFGGTAAGFAHYVRWDLAREAGDRRYRDNFFDYDFTNIYRSTQDADLVVDATPEQAERLEALIREKMGFLQGSNEHWEVRLLRHSRSVGNQTKLPLLGNPDFLEQNTDSNSTGMIELTDPPAGEGVVRDLRDWGSPIPFFLEDVTEAQLHYYESPTHQRTSRYLSGDNPPLFSVIRYLVKAFQYDLQVDGEDLRRVRAIIQTFDPQRDYGSLSPWARGWLERYGPNLIRHSVDVESAWNTLERLGLRQKLITISDPARVGTLGWWLSREPLRTRPVGNGSGRTAVELGIEVVAHETGDFLAYEAITRDTTLRPNVLVSRPGAAGEAATNGEGFYTRMGRTGARGTGLTIRFTVDPAAREGADFSLHGQYVLFTNRAALKVVPETLDVSMLQYFQLLSQGLVGPDDRGTWMKLRRRLSIRAVPPADEETIAAMVSEQIRRIGGGRQEGSGEVARSVLQAWFSLPISKLHPELDEQLFRTVTRAVAPEGLDDRDLLELMRLWLGLPLSRAHPELVQELMERYTTPHYRQNGFPNPGNMVRYAEWDELLDETLLSQGWADHPELLRALAEKGGGMLELLPRVMAHDPGWTGHPELLFDVIDGLPWNADGKRIAELLRTPGWEDHPQLVERMIQHGGRLLLAIPWILTNPGWAGHPELILALIEALDQEFPEGTEGAKQWLTGGGSFSKPRYFQLPLATALQEPAWREEPSLRALCGGLDPEPICLREGLKRKNLAAASDFARGLAPLSPPTEPASGCETDLGTGRP